MEALVIPLYVVVRRDLEPGLKLAQACHATREFTRSWPMEAVGDNLVVLDAEPEQLAELVVKAGGVCSATAFHEPDLGGELTAVALGVGARRLVSCFPLACRKSAVAA